MAVMGNGRRGGRVPTLLIAALTSFILVLGFNYWVSNSRIAELQVRITALMVTRSYPRIHQNVRVFTLGSQEFSLNVLYLYEKYIVAALF
uniref:Uncharacterized protein n=1 Tax=Denticeps clupeoides TaxID=299321 RepID=A0AAY4BHV8_9TELE